jgi:multiple sugar transport system permease protein
MRALLRPTTISKLWGYLFVLPFITAFIIFNVYPSVYAVWLSLLKYKALGQSEFIGLENYRSILTYEQFWISLKNTALYVLMYVPVGMVLSFLTAALIYSLRLDTWRQVFMAAFYLPGVISGLAVAILWRFIYDYEVGLLNWLLAQFGLAPVSWLGNIHTAMPALVLMALVGGGGGAIIIFVAALGGIPTELYDAATVDGAGWWRKLINVTLPLLVPAMLYVLVVRTIGAFQVFIPVYVLTRGGPANATMTVAYFIYRRVFYYQDLGSAAATGLLLLLATVGFTIIQFRRFSQVVEF